MCAYMWRKVSVFCHNLSPVTAKAGSNFEIKNMMKTRRIAQVFLALMGLAFCKAGFEALFIPQAVLANVGIVLDNASAYSSMRAVYGGMHFSFGLCCFWGIFRNPALPLN